MALFGPSVFYYATPNPRNMQNSKNAFKRKNARTLMPGANSGDLVYDTEGLNM